jgi:hypothetical protein
MHPRLTIFLALAACGPPAPSASTSAPAADPGGGEIAASADVPAETPPEVAPASGAAPPRPPI